MSPQVPPAPASRARRITVWLVQAALLLLGSVLVFAAILVLYPKHPPDPAWQASSGDPVPAEFLYAMFPANANVPIANTPGGTPTGVLTRALVNSQAEIDAGGWVQLQDAAASGWVPLSELRFEPPANSGVDYFAAFNAAYQARAPGDRRGASLNFGPDPSGVQMATLRLKQENHWQEYVYLISAGKAKPLEMYRIFGPGEALRNFGRVLVAAGGAMLFLIIASAVVIVRARRRRTMIAA